MKQNANLRDRRRVLNVLTYAWRRLEEPIDSQDLAAQAGLSLPQFHRVFLQVTGETPQAHLRRLRLERAAAALRYGEAGVTEVALAAGFDSREGFTRAFTEHFGDSPMAHRDRARKHMARVAAQRRVRRAAIPVSLGTFPTTRVAFWRHYGPYRQVGGACIELGRWAKPRGLLQPDALYLGLNYDDEWVTPARHRRYDACVTVPADFSLGPVSPALGPVSPALGPVSPALGPVSRPSPPADVEAPDSLETCGRTFRRGRRPAPSAPADFAGDGLIGVQEVPGGTYAVGQYEGRPFGLIDAWKWLVFCWFPASGYHAWGPWTFDVHPAWLLPTSRMELLALSVRRIRCQLYVSVSRNVEPGLLF